MSCDARGRGHAEVDEPEDDERPQAEDGGDQGAAGGAADASSAGRGGVGGVVGGRRRGWRCSLLPPRLVSSALRLGRRAAASGAPGSVAASGCTPRSATGRPGRDLGGVGRHPAVTPGDDLEDVPDRHVLERHLHARPVEPAASTRRQRRCGFGWPSAAAWTSPSACRPGRCGSDGGRRKPALDDLAAAVPGRPVAQGAVDGVPLLAALQVGLGHLERELGDEVLDLVRGARPAAATDFGSSGAFAGRCRRAGLLPLGGQPGDERVVVEPLVAVDDAPLQRPGRPAVREELASPRTAGRPAARPSAAGSRGQARSATARASDRRTQSA